MRLSVLYFVYDGIIMLCHPLHYGYIVTCTTSNLRRYKMPLGGLVTGNP